MSNVWLPRRLAVVPAPVRDEWLVSWVGRLRLSLGVTWQQAWRVLGLARYKTSYTLPPVGWWLTLSDTNVRSVTAASGLPEWSVQRMLLSRYVGTALKADTGLHGLHLVEQVRAGAGLVRSREAACLLCLAEDGAWRTSWCLPWTVACVRHQVYLTRSCPHCRRRVVFPTISSTHTRRDFCVYPHEPVVAEPVRDPVMLRAQQLVDRHMDATDEAERVVASDWFDRLMDGIKDAAVDGALDRFESADDVLRARFTEWHRLRRERLRRGRHVRIISDMSVFATDLPLAGAMMRWAVGVRGDDLHNPAPGRPPQ